MSNSIQDHIAGTNYKFEIGGVEYEMRPPTPGERDKAELIAVVFVAPKNTLD